MQLRTAATRVSDPCSRREKFARAGSAVRQGVLPKGRLPAVDFAGPRAIDSAVVPICVLPDAANPTPAGCGKGTNRVSLLRRSCHLPVTRPRTQALQGKMGCIWSGPPRQLLDHPGAAEPRVPVARKTPAPRGGRLRSGRGSTKVSRRKRLLPAAAWTSAEPGRAKRPQPRPLRLTPSSSAFDCCDIFGTLQKL
jgi:hypothetical protein